VDRDVGHRPRHLIARRAFVVSSIAAVVVTAAARALADPALDAALADVAKARAKVTTMVGPFTQERAVSLLASKVKSTGKMWLSRPDRLRWELDPPDAAVYWVLPDGLAYKTKGGSGKIPKGSQGPLGGVLGDLLVLLGGDLAALSARYDLTLVKRDDSGLVVHAAPKDKVLAKSTQRVELELAADLVTLRRVTIVEAGSDRSDIAFGAITKGAAIDPKLLSP
jgi:outer membrane lipoprotein-sorting protein